MKWDVEYTGQNIGEKSTPYRACQSGYVSEHISEDESKGGCEENQTHSYAVAFPRWNLKRGRKFDEMEESQLLNDTSKMIAEKNFTRGGVNIPSVRLIELSKHRRPMWF